MLWFLVIFVSLIFVFGALVTRQSFFVQFVTYPLSRMHSCYLRNRLNGVWSSWRQQFFTLETRDGPCSNYQDAWITFSPLFSFSCSCYSWHLHFSTISFKVSFSIEFQHPSFLSFSKTATIDSYQPMVCFRCRLCFGWMS